MLYITSRLVISTCPCESNTYIHYFYEAVDVTFGGGYSPSHHNREIIDFMLGRVPMIIPIILHLAVVHLQMSYKVSRGPGGHGEVIRLV